MMKKILLTTIFMMIFSNAGWAKKNVKYLNTHYGSVHQNANATSTSLTVLECGHPIKVIRQHSPSWSKVKAGLHSGYIKNKFLQSKRPNCFQDKYSRYFESLNLTVTDYYFWARLYDNYISSVTRPEGE
jgi:hypothetical protein